MYATATATERVVSHDMWQWHSQRTSANQQIDFGGPLHTMIITGEMHFLEQEHVKSFAESATS
jgi:diphthamide biosynthesis methyltransferase